MIKKFKHYLPPCKALQTKGSQLCSFKSG